MSIDLKSKDGQNKFIEENMSSLLEGINNSYGPVLVEELMKRLRFTIDEFNEEITSAFKDLKVKEDNRQKMYHMIKEGNIATENSDNVSSDWEDKIKAIETEK